MIPQYSYLYFLIQYLIPSVMFKESALSGIMLSTYSS